MAIQTEPTRIQIPFADSGTKNVIPDTNSTPSASQAASWTDGFPAQCSLPLSAGGIPPARADFNGVFNTMTQSERFTQEGGVWEWDATVDYGTNRMVLGSDGLLYWSVAQSGPNVGGAQNPTTDNGTYWQAPYAKTMGALENSGAIASTKWVRNAVGHADIYVNPSSGSDSNDGLTSGKAVKTISKALTLLQSRTGTPARIYLAAGTYAENLTLINVFVQFILSGNVTISGSIEAQRGTSILFSGSYTLAVSSTDSVAFSIASQSYASFLNSGTSFTASNAAHVMDTGQNCAVYFGNSVAFSGSSISSYAVNIASGSGAAFDGAVTINSSGCWGGISLSGRSYIVFSGSLTETGDFTTARGLSVSDCSNMIFQSNGTHVIYSGVSVTSSSCIEVYSGSISIISAKDRSCLDATYGGCYYQAAGDLTITSTVNTTWVVFQSDNSGCICIEGSGTFTINAKNVTQTVYCSRNALIKIGSSVAVTGVVDSGSRYRVTACGCISVSGRGVNLIPGTTAGSALAEDYALYV